jgi:hypothetical protein
MGKEEYEAANHARGGRSGNKPSANQPRCSAPQSGASRSDGADTSDRRRRCPIEDLERVFEIEFAEPGPALDARLREEQAKAVFDLLSAHKRRRPDTQRHRSSPSRIPRPPPRLPWRDSPGAAR